MAITEKSTYVGEIEGLFKESHLRAYPKNQLIHYQGDPMSSVYLIREGYIKAYIILDTGDTRTLLILGPGDIFPLAFSADMDWHNYRIKYFYQAMSDVKVQAVERDIFKEQIESDLRKMNAYVAYMSASNNMIMTQLEIMKNKKAINKMELLLPYLILKLGEQVRPNTYKLNLKLSHQELADLSGVTRETTTTLIKQMEKEGIIEQKRGYWVIHTKNDDNIYEQ